MEFYWNLFRSCVFFILKSDFAYVLGGYDFLLIYFSYNHLMYSLETRENIYSVISKGSEC